MQVVSLRLQDGLFTQIQMLASLETLKLGRRITASDLMRDVLETHLLKKNAAALAKVEADKRKS